MKVERFMAHDVSVSGSASVDDPAECGCSRSRTTLGSVQRQRRLEDRTGPQVKRSSEWVSEYDGPAIYLLKMNAPASGTVVCVLDYTSRQQWTREPSAGDHNLGGVDCRAVTVRLLRQDSQSKL